MRTRERDIEAYLIKSVKAAGGLSYKWTSPGADGVPDRIVIMPGGRVYFCELKADDGRLSGMQSYQIRRLKTLGCGVYVLRGRRGVDDFLKEITGDNK